MQSHLLFLKSLLKFKFWEVCQTNLTKKIMTWLFKIKKNFFSYLSLVYIPDHLVGRPVETQR